MTVTPTIFSEKDYQQQRMIIFGGIIGLFASLGIGRFALGMLLPATGDGLGLSYGQMGTISTFNFVGYLVAVLLCGRVTSRFSLKSLIIFALFLIGSTLVLIGLVQNYYLIVVLYFLTGVGSGFSNVPLMAVVSIWFRKENRGRIAGLFVMGNGLGILFSGQVVPICNKSAIGWPLSWILLGLIVLIVSSLCFVLLPGFAPKEAIETAEIDKKSEDQDSSSSVSSRFIYHCGAIYFLFGFTYVIYVTFFVTALVQDRNITEEAAGVLWSWVGFISLVSGPLFGYLSDKYGRRVVLCGVFLMQASAYLLVALEWPLFSLYCSIILFGLVAWSVPTIIAAWVGDHAGPEKTAAVFGFVTFVFGIGQIFGPLVGGKLADITHSFSLSFYIATFFTLVAVLLVVKLPEKKNRKSDR